MALRDVIPALNGFRRLNLLEAGHVLSGNALQLVLKVSGDGVAERIVEKLKKEVIAFRLRSDGFQFIPATTDNLVVHRIPDGMSDVLEVDNWAVNEHPVISADRLGEISANERFVALNISHACSDGMYIAGIIDHILDPVKELTAVFPTPSDVVFAQEAAALKSFEFSNARETLLSLNRPRVGREKPLIRRVACNASTRRRASALDSANPCGRRTSWLSPASCRRTNSLVWVFALTCGST